MNAAGGEPIEKLANDAREYWSASEHSDAIKELSHWRGVGRWNEESWLDVGRKSLDLYRQFARMINYEGPLRKVVEWGPGGGSNAVAFGSEVETYYGVDISKANLEECSGQMAGMGFAERFKPVHIANADKPEEVFTEIAGKECDLFLSTAVFQHFPGKAYAVKVLGIAYHLLKPGGLAIIQTRFDDGLPQTATKNSDYKQNAIVFTSFYIPEFWYIAEEMVGFKPVSLSLSLKSSYAYYFFQK